MTYSLIVELNQNIVEHNPVEHPNVPPNNFYDKSLNNTFHLQATHYKFSK